MNAVIFDIDGTLLQSAEIDDELYRKSVVAVLGSVRFRDRLSDYDLVTDSGVLAQLLEDNGLIDIPDPTEAIQAHFVDALASHIYEFGPFAEVAGARKFVKALRNSSDHSVAIATGGWRPSALLKLRSADFEVDDIPIATSDDECDRSRIMLAALAKLGGDFESITYYGDGSWDRDACSVLGWQFVPVGRALNGLTSYSAASVG